jgi:hypothetical protein
MIGKLMWLFRLCIILFFLMAGSALALMGLDLILNPLFGNLFFIGAGIGLIAAAAGLIGCAVAFGGRI